MKDRAADAKGPAGSFSILTVGTSFDKKRFGDQIKAFAAPGEKAAAAAAGTNAAGIAAAAAVSAPIPVAAPVAAPLSFFSKKESDDDAKAEAAVPEKPAKAHTPLPVMSMQKKQNIWRKHKLAVKGSDLPAPIEHFSNLVRPPLSVPEYVVDNLFKREHKIPTPIQMQAIPTLIARNDLLACAPTGSGKTLAYLIPLFGLLKKPSPTAGVRALIVAPTMELAMQVEREAFLLMKGDRWKLVQHGQTTKNKDIFVSTPGRVSSMLQQGLVDLSAVEFVVFDEGDKLWDKSASFLDDMDRIVAACKKPDKVVCVFSATLSEQVEEMARSVMTNNVVRIIVNSRRSASHNVDQRLIFVGNELGKVVAMKNFIREGIKPPVLVFVQSIERSKELYEEISRAGLHVAMMNSRMTAEERDDVVLRFRLGQVWFLITTELLARGIDFKNIGTVVNFDFPTTVASYIHRVGRTGRAGNRGLAVTFFTEEDKERLPGVAKVVREAGSEVPDWMLAIEVDRKRQRQLAHSTPQRMVVSTKKRMLIGEQRIQRQLNAVSRDKSGAAADADAGAEAGAAGKRGGRNARGKNVTADEDDSEDIGGDIPTSDDDFDDE